MPVKQPNSRFCFVCGLENPIGLHLKFYETRPGEITSDIYLPDRYQGYPGVVHGGIVAAMLDEAAGRVHMGPVDQPRFMFTARLSIRYRKNVPVETPLKLVGRVGESRLGSATASSAIYDLDGNILAEAEGLMMDVPESMLAEADLAALGWKVYED